MIILEKYTERDFELYSELVFNEQVMNMNMGRVFTKEEADFFFKATPHKCQKPHYTVGAK